LEFEEYVLSELNKIKKPSMEMFITPNKKNTSVDLGSHFGGKPYIQKDAIWHTCPVCEEPMNFFFQFREILINKDVSLKTFFTCDCTLKSENKPSISFTEYLNPEIEFHDESLLNGRHFSDYLEIEFIASLSVPHFGLLKKVNPELREFILKEIPNTEDAESFYDNLRREGDYISDEPFTLAYGYPEYYEEPTKFYNCSCCKQPLDFYFQIDSIDRTFLNWNDSTLYCFVCPRSLTYHFTII
jgi:hypothetical protein